MDSGEQLVMMLMVILVLGLAYFGVTFWSTRRSASTDGPGAGGGPGGSELPAHLSHLLDETEPVESASDARQKRTQRLDLTGARAEMAAKVLKRMLKDDRQGPR